MQSTPATVISEKRNSRAEKRFLKIMGSKSAVKKPISEKQMTPMDTLEALMLP